MTTHPHLTCTATATATALRRAATTCALLATTLSASALTFTAAATPAAAEPCRSQVTGTELPEGADPHPMIDQLGLRQAWDLTTGEDVTVAVIDSGVDARHPDLQDRVDQGSEFATTIYDERGFERNHPARQSDCEGHGTAVAGIIAARRAASDRMAGVAPGARVYPVRVPEMERSPTKAIAAAIDDAVAADVDVINLSLTTSVDRQPIRRAVADAVAADIVVVAAAGNDGSTANGSGAPRYPAAYQGVLAVGAVDADGQPLDSSSAGPWVDLAAFGYEDLVVLAPGGSGYRLEGGTSMAAAQVSGVAALVRSRAPELTAAEVAERLTGSTTRLGGGVNEHTGAGLVDPFGALTHLGSDPSGADEAAGTSPGRIPVQALPEPQPLLSRTAGTALAWSGGLLLAMLLGLLAAPAIRRAARRGWHAGPSPHDPANVPAGGPATHPPPPATSLDWLGGSPDPDVHTLSHRNGTP